MIRLQLFTNRYKSVALMGKARTAGCEALGLDTDPLLHQNQVLIAYGDVEDALTDLCAFSDQVGSLREAVSASQNYLRPAQSQYKYSLVDYLIVIDAERTLLANQLSLAQVVNLHVAASIRLIKALGGGWNPAAQSPPRGTAAPS
jgi:outer membrane protein TolC